MQALPKPGADELGYLQLTSDGAVLASRGTLQNDETTAKALAQLVAVACRSKVFPRHMQQQQLCKITVVYEHHYYTVCLANKRLHIVKKNIKASGDASSPN
ncbi:ragulator complex protein LAMTOR4 homolog [Hyalella azteca]|uniref:Late endosomal/lysosomal adaptor and MAPK and MTOR activator 4 n=1 Tax=Hyalella azteca TaxID=294128 RepID=A0A8B7NTX4_HYAAZ|nr:ragulator complex protein LAMTOR4 homolog [Hyalella azteca]